MNPAISQGFPDPIPEVIRCLDRVRPGEDRDGTSAQRCGDALVAAGPAGCDALVAAGPAGARLPAVRGRSWPGPGSPGASLAAAPRTASEAPVRLARCSGAGHRQRLSGASAAGRGLAGCGPGDAHGPEGQQPSGRARPGPARGGQAMLCAFSSCLQATVTSTTAVRGRPATTTARITHSATITLPPGLSRAARPAQMPGLCRAFTGRHNPIAWSQGCCHSLDSYQTGDISETICRGKFHLSRW